VKASTANTPASKPWTNHWPSTMCSGTCTKCCGVPKAAYSGRNTAAESTATLAVICSGAAPQRFTSTVAAAHIKPAQTNIRSPIHTLEPPANKPGPAIATMPATTRPKPTSRRAPSRSEKSQADITALATMKAAGSSTEPCANGANRKPPTLVMKNSGPINSEKATALGQPSPAMSLTPWRSSHGSSTSAAPPKRSAARSTGLSPCDTASRAEACIRPQIAAAHSPRRAP
jgi:hypothetical protein